MMIILTAGGEPTDFTDFQSSADHAHKTSVVYVAFYISQSVKAFDGHSVTDWGTTTFSNLGVQFLCPGYYYPSTEKKLDRSTQFGAVGYSIHEKAM